ncbi:hypothetical protein N7519_002667 [Penicillium mononematosum]|uniref:uncharacterized protein n=1 Tax=Penicillium mononematosum TaxID=268346 RepID=UPI0025480DC0|nr:uncharacterized protein N7519_002667 [Penicillium mononematosum]KAJ6187759.1 hypothetical protein N7519_002667 [Penicillium mononematosum]
MDDDPVNIIPQAWCFIWRCERLEQILISMKEITTSFIPQQRLQVLRIDLNHLDIATGITSPSEKILEDPSWDWFLSQRGVFGKGTYRANYLLRRAFMDYQDSSIPEFWPRELYETEIEEKDNNEDPTAKESSDQPDNTGGDKESDNDKPHDKEVNKGEEINCDKAREGETVDPETTGESDEDGDKSEESGGNNRKPSDESHEKSEKSEKEADDSHEMVIPKALDLDIRNYRTNDWSVYWHQRLYDLDLPDNAHGISIARSMELNHPHKCHAWALVDVILCGYERPSTAELIALASWGLRGMFRQLESLANGIKPEDVHMLMFDQRCCARVLYGYFDGRLQVQFTPVLNFKEFTEVRSPTLDGYMGKIDKNKYYDMMHSLLRWAWPLGHHLTTLAIAQP